MSEIICIRETCVELHKIIVRLVQLGGVAEENGVAIFTEMYDEEEQLECGTQVTAELRYTHHDALGDLILSFEEQEEEIMD